MPLCTLHLLSLSTPLPDFLAALSAAALPAPPLTTARVVRWIITPTRLSADPLLSRTWDLLLILPTPDTSLPPALSARISARWTLTFGMPRALLAGYAAKNARLLRDAGPPLTRALDDSTPTTSAQSLELSGELLDWMREFGERETGGGRAVSMLNLLAFRAGRKDEYLAYGAAFAAGVGSRRGGVAKVVGTVVGDGGGSGVGEGGDGKRVWDEVALAHYPSIWHFADMLAGEDYQAVNRRHRVGSLEDTFILCTTEVGLPTFGGDGKEKERDGGAAAKL